MSQRALGGAVDTRLFTRQRVVSAALGLLALLLVFLIVHDVLVPARPTASGLRLVSAQLGTVSSAVQGTGTVTPATQLNVNFQQAGTVTEIDVQAGQQVTQGQTLAKIDPATLQQALDQANNNLQSAQAQLNNTVDGNALQQAQDGLNNAQQSLNDTQAQVNLTSQQDANAIANDQNNLNNDQNNLNNANAAVNQAQANVGPAKSNLDTLQAEYNTNLCGTSSANPNVCTPALSAKLATAQAEYAAAAGQLNTAQQAANQAQTAVNSDQKSLTTDQNKQASDQVSSQKTLDSARASVTTAQDTLNSQTIQRPNTITQQQASVGNAQLAVQTAQKNLSEATLTAPIGGTVVSINGQVGAPESGGGGSSASSSSASSSSSSSSAGGAAGAGGSGGSGGSGGTGSSSAGSGGSSSGTGFIVLQDVSGMQVSAPFAEADASKLQVGQSATVTFDAVSGLTVPAHIVSIAPAATTISNVVNFYATLILDRLDSRLRSGMTANANVVVQNVAGVLRVPNSVITRLGGTSYVTVMGANGKEVRQPVRTGTVGDTYTEITSGLNAGDRVVVPQLTLGTSGAGAGGRVGGGAGGLGGGGGFRVGGGG